MKPVLRRFHGATRCRNCRPRMLLGWRCCCICLKSLDTPSVGRQAFSCDHLLHEQCVTEMRRRGVSPETFALLAKPPFFFPVGVDRPIKVPLVASPYLGRCHNVGKRTRTWRMIGREAYPEAARVQDWHQQLDKDKALKP